MNKHKSEHGSTDAWLSLIAIAIMVVIAALFACGKALWHHTHVDHITATITKMERVNYGDSSKYLVWTDVQDEQGTHSETFEDVDAWYFRKWNSSDVYGALEIGKTYNLKVSGVRWRFMSWYRNIVEIE